MRGSVASRRVMLRAGVPAEEDDSKETNIAVDLPRIESKGQGEKSLKITLESRRRG
jgi:hypothetical protein